MQFKTESGIEIEFRRLTWSERKEASKKIARYLQDHAAAIDAHFYVCECCIEKIDGSEATKELLNDKLGNDDIVDVGKEIFEESGLNKKKSPLSD